MKPTFKEAEKALKFIADMGLNAGAYARQEIGRISEWQQLNMSAIRSLSDSLKTTTDKVAREVLANELKLRTLVYRHEYKKKMRHRRVMKLARDLYALFMCTRNLKSGLLSRDMDGNAGKAALQNLTLHGPYGTYAELQHAVGQNCPMFVIRTPYKWYEETIDLVGQTMRPWMLDALQTAGYELYGATLE